MALRRGSPQKGTGAKPVDLNPPAVMDKDPRMGFLAGGCSACALPHNDLLALNLLLADPNQWPRTIFAGLKLPAGALPPGYRLWGAVKLGLAWLDEHGYKINEKTVKRHYNNHVVQVPADAAHFIGSAMLAEADHRSPRPLPQTVKPVDFRPYYGKGLELGEKALDMMLERMQFMEAEGEDVPMELLVKAADIGAKLATSAASITSKGMDLDRQKKDELEAFRAGSAPLPSQNLGDSRIRVIEGEARPVRDRGRSDRRDYNERAREEGKATLPA